MTHGYPVRESRRRFRGRVVAVRTDDVVMPDGSSRERDVVEHPGAVGVVALDEADRVVLVRQYRHPVGARLWELPAGLLDVAGEPPWRTAARELREEAGLSAGNWQVLADLLTSPGMTDEVHRIYLARDLSPAPQPAAADEEADMELARVPLARAVQRIFSGDIRNGPTCAGLLAAAHAQADGFRGLRRYDATLPPGSSQPG